MKIDFPLCMLGEDETFVPYLLADADESHFAWPLFETFDDARSFSTLIGKTLMLSEFINAQNLLTFMKGTLHFDRLSHVLRGRLIPRSDAEIPLFSIRETTAEFFRQLQLQADEEAQSAYN